MMHLSMLLEEVGRPRVKLMMMRQYITGQDAFYLISDKLHDAAETSTSFLLELRSLQIMLALRVLSLRHVVVIASLQRPCRPLIKHIHMGHAPFLELALVGADDL